MADEKKEEEEQPKKRQRPKRGLRSWNGKWDEETRNKFEDEMEIIVNEMIGEHQFNSNGTFPFDRRLFV